MNYINLFEMQKSLDGYIERNHGLEAENLFERKLLAFMVELSELANETRCFKFWSVKPSSEKNIVLEEYVDGFHFLLSIGIELGFHNFEFDEKRKECSSSITGAFLAIYQAAGNLGVKHEEREFIILFELFLELGNLLGFTEEEIEGAYIRKNEVNYERQQNGY